MNDAWGYDDNNESGDNAAPETPKALRDAYAALKKQNEDLISSLAADRAERAKEKLSSVFSELGVPGAVDLYSGEPDPEKAKAWALSMQAAFGTSNTQAAATSEVVQPTIDQQTQAQFQSMNEAGQNGTPMGNFDSAQSAVGNASDLQSLIAAMAQANHMNG